MKTYTITEIQGNKIIFNGRIILKISFFNLQQVQDAIRLCRSLLERRKIDFKSQIYESEFERCNELLMVEPDKPIV